MLDAPADAVWDDLADVGTHAEWMTDAESLRFTSEQHRGVGTTYVCVTRVGPIRLDDAMAVEEWDEAARVLAVRHEGVVTGTGRFTLHPVAAGRRTLFVWDETLAFPWWLGGVLSERLGRPILLAIWQGNLRRLADRFG